MRWISVNIFFALFVIGPTEEKKSESGAVLANHDGDRNEPINIETDSGNIYLRKELILVKTDAGEDEKALLINTNYSVEVRLVTHETYSYISGEIVGNYIFVYTRTIFYWDDTVDGVAGTTINKENGTPLEISVLYYNTKYASYLDALEHRDGIVEVRIRVKANSDEDNSKFEPFGEILKEIENPNSFDITMKKYNSWYLDFKKTAYYAYPGSLKNASTGETKNCVITIVTELVLEISRKQFEETFLKMKDKNNEQLITKQETYQTGNRPVIYNSGETFIDGTPFSSDEDDALYSTDS